VAERDIVVIGGSAGGVPALIDVLAPLPRDFPAAIFVVLHTAAEGGGMLSAVLERHGVENVTYAVEAEPIRHGHVYLAPPDHHLLINRDLMRVARGPRENRFRPAVDPLFRTAARAYGPRTIGIVLSGGLDDGTHGLEFIKRQGGLAIAQDPEDAIAPGMPMSAIQNVEVDYILKPAAIGAKLPVLVQEQVADAAIQVPEGSDVAEGKTDTLQSGDVPGPPSPYTCPDCGGALWEFADGTLLRYQCHVGHGFTASSLHAEQTEGLEHTLWGALRALEEQASFRRRMALHAEHAGRLAHAREFEKEAKESEDRAGSLRRLLLTRDRVAR
jgi:two-component system chemotaxis response regulator CheB